MVVLEREWTAYFSCAINRNLIAWLVPDWVQFPSLELNPSPHWAALDRPNNPAVANSAYGSTAGFGH